MARDRHQRKIRVNRHRKHIANWRWGMRFDKETCALYFTVKRNGFVVYEHARGMYPELAAHFTTSETLRPFFGIKQ